MRTSFIAAAALAASAIAAPSTEIADLKRAIIKRQSVTTGASDAVVLNFALTLEHLEDVFYTQALAKYSEADFVAAGYSGVYALLKKVAADEANHVAFLTSALTAAGATPVAACVYNFPYNSVASFLALSSVLEGVGTSAYLGAAGSIATPAFLTAAGSILTVEARHNAFIRFLGGASPFPSAYDTPLSATSVVTLATPFFVSCPAGSAPAIAGRSALAVTTAAPAVGAALAVAPMNATLASTFKGTVYCGFASGLGAGFSVWNNGSCMIPTANVTDGQTYVFLTSGPSVADASVLAGPAILLLGPTNIKIALGGSAATPAGAAAATATLKSSASALVSSSVFAFFAGALALVL